VTTPLKRVEGYGSAKTGSGTWKAERFTSLVLVPLTVWGLWSAWSIAGSGFEGATAWLRDPVNAGLLVVTLAVSLWHMALGLRVIIEDYVHGFLGQALLFLNTLFCAALFVVAAISIAAVAFGVALGVGSGAS